MTKTNNQLLFIDVFYDLNSLNMDIGNIHLDINHVANITKRMYSCV